MKIWTIFYDQDYESFASIGIDDLIFFNKGFRGEKIRDYNKEIVIETGFEGEKSLKGDICSLGIVPIFMPRAMSILRPLLKNDIQSIKVKHNVYGECYAINVTKVLDCLDEDKSVIERMKSGRLFRIKKYEFKKDIKYPDIFKITTDGKSGVFVTENFVKLVKENELKGIVCEEVWESD